MRKSAASRAAQRGRKQESLARHGRRMAEMAEDAAVWRATNNMDWKGLMKPEAGL
jgi:hypothetical protein